MQPHNEQDTDPKMIGVANIIEMTLEGDATFKSIKDDASESALTQRICSNTVLNDGSGAVAGCKVKTMLVSDFFINANPSSIKVTGTAVMEFARARRLSSFRGLQQQQQQQASGNTTEQFSLTVPLQPMDMGDNPDASTQDNIDMIDSAASPVATTIIGMVSFVVATVFSFILI